MTAACYYLCTSVGVAFAIDSRNVLVQSGYYADRIGWGIYLPRVSQSKITTQLQSRWAVFRDDSRILRELVCLLSRNRASPDNANRSVSGHSYILLRREIMSIRNR